MTAGLQQHSEQAALPAVGCCSQRLTVQHLRAKLMPDSGCSWLGKFILKSVTLLDTAKLPQ